MKIIGLTGGIASGKNFVAEIFKKDGAAIFDADAESHSLLESDKRTIDEVSFFFPESLKNQKIDRKTLGKIVFTDRNKLQILEKILHPKIYQKYCDFLKKSHREQRKIAILNIPLLLEKQSYKCDKIISVVVSSILQKYRFLAREKKKNPQNFFAEIQNFEKKFSKVSAKQLGNLERKKKSDFIINNCNSRAETIKQTKKILAKLKTASKH